MGLPLRNATADSLFMRLAKETRNRISFTQVTLLSLGIADHICGDIVMTLANSNSPAAG
jgi:hypothetical protein